MIAPCPDIGLIKEIGDAVFLSAPSFRELFESLVLMDQVSHQLADLAGTQQYPFGIRAGIGSGPAKRLPREHQDFLGAPIDQLSRIMSVRSNVSNLLIDEDAYQPSKDIIREYEPVVEVAAPKMVPEEKSKGMIRPVYYRETIVDRRGLVEFRSCFSYWR